MSLGEQLRNAREARKETASQVAAATRLKIQAVEAIEREDFSKIPATIYGKGFIKLYAEHVGLDPQPLIQEYLARFATNSRPHQDSLVEEPAAPEPEPPPAAPAQPEPEKEVRRKPRRGPKDFFEPDLFAHAGLSTEEPAPAVAPPAPVGNEPESPVEAPLESPAPAAPSVPEPELPAGYSLPEPEAPSAQEMPSTPEPETIKAADRPTLPERPALPSLRDIVVETPGGRETAESGLHSPHAWNSRPAAGVNRSIVDPDILLHKKPEMEPAGAPADPEPVDDLKEVEEKGLGLDRLDFKSLSLSKSPMKTAFLLLGIVIILVFVISGLSRCMRKPVEHPLPVIIDADKELHTAVPPPTPYFD